MFPSRPPRAYTVLFSSQLELALTSCPLYHCGSLATEGYIAGPLLELSFSCCSRTDSCCSCLSSGTPSPPTPSPLTSLAQVTCPHVLVQNKHGPMARETCKSTQNKKQKHKSVVFMITWWLTVVACADHLINSILLLCVGLCINLTWHSPIEAEWWSL